MGLKRREVTEPMRAANRANSKKSTGPRTEEGKRNSRRSAFKHGIYGDELCPWGKELGEDSADYRRFCRRIVNAFRARDGVEAMLAGDMARTQWRLARVLRAESACLALERGKLENSHCRTLANEGMGVRVSMDKIISDQAGYAPCPSRKVSMN